MQATHWHLTSFANASGATWENAVGHRSYTLTSTNEQTLPFVYFHNQNHLGPITIQLHFMHRSFRRSHWSRSSNTFLVSATLK